MSGDGMSAQRPGPGSPREYRFPRSVEHLTANGLRIIVLPMPARPLASVQLLLPGGAALETASNSGLTAALARLLTEGGERHDADQLVEASELLGAKIGAEAGWESVVIGASLPASRLAGILDLVAEIALAPRVPDREVDRVKALRLAAIEQSQASPRARASEALIAEIYGASAAYSRPMGGTRESVAAISRDALMERHALLLGAGVPTLVIAGELEAAEVIRTVESSPLAQLHASAPAAPTAADAPSDGSAGTAAAPRLLLLDRPGSVQSELRIGKVGRSRLDPLFYAALIHSEVLGGLFGSRLNRVLREEKGYTYGAAAGFEFRRGRGPFTARTAVESSVTAPALVEARAQIASMTPQPPSDDELNAARQYLRGTFPLRFGSASPVAGAVAGLVAVGLEPSELDRFQSAIDSVSGAEVARVAAALDAETERIVVVGDAATVAAPLRDAGFAVEVHGDARGA
jgi:predicted Zn-dependent peptidase